MAVTSLVLVRSVAAEGVKLGLSERWTKYCWKCRAGSSGVPAPAQPGSVGVEHRGLGEGDRVPAVGHRQLRRQLTDLEGVRARTRPIPAGPWHQDASHGSGRARRRRSECAGPPASPHLINDELVRLRVIEKIPRPQDTARRSPTNASPL